MNNQLLDIVASDLVTTRRLDATDASAYHAHSLQYGNRNSGDRLSVEEMALAACRSSPALSRGRRCAPKPKGREEHAFPSTCGGTMAALRCMKCAAGVSSGVSKCTSRDPICRPMLAIWVRCHSLPGEPQERRATRDLTRASSQSSQCGRLSHDARMSIGRPQDPRALSLSLKPS